MFKIENYITPIITNYLAKYVKNIRPQDFQMSLWEGEVTFQNLDLRLDVLKKELHLPFELLSGHIHELSIQVPWTKITSEPIRVNINTIEFILESKELHKDDDEKFIKNVSDNHKDATATDEGAPASVSTNKKDDETHISRITKRIVNNINFRCENIIFKYIEEDIVLSMNIQLLNFSSSNNKWKPHIEDISVPNVVSRKLISISDLTVCLDKRNASGQIDVCHEPLIYRCSLECRILRTYNVQTKALSSTTRVGVFTKAVDLNLSSMQLPMVVRLIRTILTLADTESKIHEMNVPSQNQNQPPSIYIAEDAANESENNLSLFTWAWSFVPNFFSNNGEGDDTKDSPGHINELGIYLEELNFILKNSEHVTDALVGGIIRVHYTPIVQFSLGGVYFETVTVKEIDWKNIKMGVSSMLVKSADCHQKIGDCDHNGIIVETEPFTNKQAFIDKSLFDEHCKIPDKGWIVTNYEDYRIRITDAYLLYRSPVFGFDQVEYYSNFVKMDEEIDPSTSAVSPAETNYLHKEVRALGAVVVIRYNETFDQVTNVLRELLECHDYSMYTNAEKAETKYMPRIATLVNNTESENGGGSIAKDEINNIKNSSKLHPPQVEDYDQLMLGVPLCVYKIDIKRITVEMYPKLESAKEFEYQRQCEGQRSKRKPKPFNFKNYTLPFLSIFIDHIEGELSTPINPDKLIHTTCQLPDKPLQLLTACYKNINFVLRNVTANIVIPYYQQQQQSQPQQHLQRTTTYFKSKILHIPKLTFDYGVLLQPFYWKVDEVPTDHIDIQCDNIKIEFSISQFIMTLLLIQAIVKYRSELLTLLQEKVCRSKLVRINTAKMHNILTKLYIKRRQYHTYEIWNATLTSVQVDLVLDQEYNVNQAAQHFSVLSTSSLLHNNQNKWLEVQLQLPVVNRLQQQHNADEKGEKVPVAFGLWMEKFSLNIDKHMSDFLTFTDLMSSEEPSMTPMNLSTIKHCTASEFSPKPIITTVTPATAGVAAVLSSTSQLKNALPQVFGRSGGGRLKHSSSRPAESTHSASEHDETHPSVIPNPLCNADEANIIIEKFQRYYSIIIMVDMAQSHLYLGRLTDSNQMGDFQGEFTHISTPHILWKSTFAEYVTRSSLRLKTKPPALKESNTFNWTIHIQDFNIKVYQDNQWSVILNSWDTTLTIAMIPRSCPSNNHIVERRPRSFKRKHTADNVTTASASFRDTLLSLKTRYCYSYSLNLHIDSGIMEICINHGECVLNQLAYLGQLIKLMQLINDEIKASKITTKSKDADYKTQNEIKILMYGEEDVRLKEFMELDTNSNKSSLQLQAMSSSEALDLKCITIFCQWTVTKILMELYGETKQKNKIVIDFEDLLFTVDHSEEFTKYTNKIGNFQLRYYEMDSNKFWIIQDNLSIRRINDTSDHPFFNAIYTMASLRDFYKRLGVERKTALTSVSSSSLTTSARNNISEIDIVLQAMEVVIDFDYLVQFIQPLCLFCAKPTHQTNDKIITKGHLVTTDKLPLIHFESKGVTFYFPSRYLVEHCTVLICKIDSINMSSTLKNPLQRNPLRPQVFAKATSMGILALPGSLIEDRQYEVTLQHISAATGNWNDILLHMQNKMKSGHANPAVEWNNPERKPDLTCNDIFKNFTLITIYAPNIVYNNILICGAAIEFNCASDFVATISTDQLSMLGCHWRNIQQIIEFAELCCTDIPSTPCSHLFSSESSLYTTANNSLYSFKQSSTNAVQCTTKIPIKSIQTTTRFKSIDENSENIVNTDSGIQSNSLESQKCKMLQKEHMTGSLLSLDSGHDDSRCLSNTSLLDKTSSGRNAVERHIPSTMSLVAGVFVLQIFESSKVFAQRSSKVALRPLMSCTISQPSFMFTQNIFDSLMQFSIFNIGLHLSNNVVKIQMDDTNKPINFPIALFDTMIGEPKSTGIPPTLFNYKLSITKLQRRETDIEFGRPIVLILNENYAAQLWKNLLIIFKSVNNFNCFKTHTHIPIKRRTTKIKLIKQKILDADRMSIKLNMFMIKFINFDEHLSNFVFCDILLHLKYLNKPEKCLTRLNIGAFYVRTMNKMFLHPVSIKLSIDLISEPWLRLPLLSGIIKFNLIHIDIGIDAILHLRKCLNGTQRILEYICKEWEIFWSRSLQSDSSSSSIHQWSTLNLIKYRLSETYVKNSKHMEHDEYYQDDLRAGAFQFVELTTDVMLPLPYQIQIIKKDYGIICWRYPQPRKMVKIFINPVPMMSKAATHIKCRMEYFSEVQEKFVHYCEFWLSETVSKNVELPERSICAYIWRVVILQSSISVDGNCFDGSEEDDEELESINSSQMGDILNNLNDRRHIVLNPKILVGCMRVDTIFQIQLIPKIQFMLRCNEICVNFLNKSDAYAALPSILRKYRIVNIDRAQTFLVISLQNISIYGNILNENKYNVDINLSGNIKCLDYGFLNMLPLMKATSLWCYFELDKINGILITNVVCEPLHINVGPAIIHTLLISKNHWEELLDRDERRTRYALIPKCTIVNRTLSDVAFGQTGTTEHIKLKPTECYLYSFGSDYYKQELTFYVTNKETNINTPSESLYIPLKFENDYIMRYIPVGDIFLVLKLRKLTNYQIYILIRGQIEVVSMIRHNLYMEFRSKKNPTAKEDDKHISEFSINKRAKSSINLPIQKNSNICFRLKLMESQAYSGEIPLIVNKKLPWLVKVPTSLTEYITFWVRVLREDIKELRANEYQPQKVLITIWPIFQIVSYLNCPMELCQLEHSEDIVRVASEKGVHALDVAATHLTDHDVNFFFSFPVTVQSKTHYNLNLKSLNWQNFFWYDEINMTVENALKLLTQPAIHHWPFNDENESHIRRISSNSTKVDVIYNLSEGQEYSCTLALEVAPWGVFVNSSGLQIQLSDLKHQHITTIVRNGMEMLSDLSSGFHIEIPYGTLWKSSLPIFLENVRHTNINTNTNTNIKTNVNSFKEFYVLSKSENCDIIMTMGEAICRFVLTLSIENNRKVLKLISKFAAVNFTKLSLYVLPFVISCKDSVDQARLSSLNMEIPEIKVKAVASWETCVGVSLPIFYNIRNDIASNNDNSNKVSYVYFISIKSNVQSDISLPVPLEMPFKRRCFSIQNGNVSLPLAVTINEKNGIIYLAIAEDIQPALLINNETDCSFMIGQTKAMENSTIVTVTREYEQHHFDWHHKVPKQCQTYYTPPAWYVNYPETDTTLCNITLALWHDGISSKTVKWSNPMRVNKAHKKFLHIPGHGDVQIIICDKHRIVRFNILYVSQQMEFSIKDLRSRLSFTRSISTSDEFNYEELQAQQEPAQPQFSEVYPTIHSLSSRICHHFRNDIINENQLRLRLFIKEIILCLHIDSYKEQYLKEDVFCLHMDDVLIAYNDTKDDDKRELNILIPNLQIDNQLFSTGRFDFPVVLCSEKLYEKTSYQPMAYYLDRTYDCLKQTMPMLSIKLYFYEDEYKIHTLKCYVSPVRAYIEDAYVTGLLDALVECDPTNCAYKPKLEFERRLMEADQIIIPNDVVAAVVYIMDPLYMRNFLIEPMHVLLSVHTSVRLYIALDHSPLSFSIYQREHLLTLPLKLGQSLGMHYLSGAIFGAGWVVGSLEILGSPSGLARSVTMGLKDFISLPVKGLFRGPWGFILGITQGSASLFKNITAGTVNSVTKLAASVARNLDRLSLDNEHIERTESLRRSRPQGFTEGVFQGMTGLGISILGAVGGLAHHTLDATCTSEVFTGVGKGLVGAFTKPISGAAELLALAGQGMLHTVGFNALPKQRSPSNCRNIAVEPSVYRLWKILPTELLSDQILFFNDITVLTNETLTRGYICLTSTLFAIIDRDWDQLRIAYPIDKMDVQIDDKDTTLCYVRLKSEQDNFAEVSRYTAARILSFLQSSNLSFTSPSLVDLMYSRSTVMDNNRHENGNYDYAFHISEHYAEYILCYLKILNMQHIQS